MTTLSEQARKEHFEIKQREMFQPGKFVMLHHECCIGKVKHPDAGRIGKIIKCDLEKKDMIVEFWTDEMVGGATYCLIPFGHWLPLGDYMIEEYEPRVMKRGWRINDYAKRIFDNMGWKRTLATEGKT